MVYVPALFLLVILIAFHKLTRCRGVCDNGKTPWGGGCCLNYHMVGGICKACPVGYIGENCALSCPYPFFGDICYHKCHCSHLQCNHRYGCKEYDSTVPARSRTPMRSKSSPSNVTDHRITVPIKTKYNPSITNHCTEFNSTTIIMIIGGIVILLLILIIIFQIYERNCKNRERKRPAVHVQNRLYEYNTEPAPCYINDFHGRMEANSLQASGTTEDI